MNLFMGNGIIHHKALVIPVDVANCKRQTEEMVVTKPLPGHTEQNAVGIKVRQLDYRLTRL